MEITVIESYFFPDTEQMPVSPTSSHSFLSSDGSGNAAITEPWDRSFYGIANGKLQFKQHRCMTCKKRFLWHSDLRKHERIHTGERPYSCQWCGRGFTQVQHMRSHMFRCAEKQSTSVRKKGKYWLHWVTFMRLKLESLIDIQLCVRTCPVVVHLYGYIRLCVMMSTSFFCTVVLFGRVDVANKYCVFIIYSELKFGGKRIHFE